LCSGRSSPKPPASTLSFTSIRARVRRERERALGLEPNNWYSEPQDLGPWRAASGSVCEVACCDVVRAASMEALRGGPEPAEGDTVQWRGGAARRHGSHGGRGAVTVLVQSRVETLGGVGRRRSVMGTATSSATKAATGRPDRPKRQAKPNPRVTGSSWTK
jgi:hypothetical protein